MATSRIKFHLARAGALDQQSADQRGDFAPQRWQWLRPRSALAAAPAMF